MKKTILGFVAILSFTVIIAQEAPMKEVGKLDSGTPILTIDKAAAISALTANLKRFSQLEVSYKDVTITRREDYYLLVFTGDRYVSVFYVEVKGDILRAMTGITCTTSACLSEVAGCTVEKVQSSYRCTPCTNREKCTKISSSTSLIDSEK